MSRASSTAKRYAGSSYTSHYGSYGASLGSSLGSYGERDRLTYKSSSSSYTPSSYFSSTGSRPRAYGTSVEPDRGRTTPRADLLGGRRSESMSRAPVRSYSSGLSGGGVYSSFSYSPSVPSYLSSSPATSSISLSRRRSVSQSDLTHELTSLALRDPTSCSSSSSSPSSSSSSGLRSSYHSRGSEPVEPYSSSRFGSAVPRGSIEDTVTNGNRFTPSWDRGFTRSISPTRDSPVRHCLIQ